ncbi:hypothetical protein [Deinococcus sp.]|uniref:hypothetical protein n=1 Tax=Deinococcus sp. TaxID=47478 RepID=UPI0025ED7111|nr:hypothetical protein [Deinococcus sp.]
MNQLPATFRLWLTVALCVGWTALLVVFIVRANLPLAALSAVLLAVYGYRLYNLLRRQ